MSDKLGKNHQRALDLIEEGLLTFVEISEECKLGFAELFDLYSGKQDNLGKVAGLFKVEIDKITKRNQLKVKNLIKDNKKLALVKMNEFLRTQQGIEPTASMMKDVLKCINSLNKLTPAVEINYSKGLTAEDLIREFQRLKSVATHSLNRKRVSSVGEGEPGVLSLSPRAGDTTKAE